MCEKLKNDNVKAYLFRDERITASLRLCFVAWTEVTLSHNRKVLQKKIVKTEYFKSKKKGILAVLSAVAIGANSGNKILQRRQNALDQAREVLTKKLAERDQTHGVITSDLLHVELQRIFHNELQKWDQKRYLWSPFMAMKETMLIAKHVNQKACDHRKKRYLMLPFEQWKTSSSKKIGRFRYNQVEVDSFAKSRLSRMALKRWHGLARIHSLVAQKRRAILTRLASSCITAWSLQAKFNKAMKLRVIGQWINYRNTMMRCPLKKWIEWTVNMRDRERLFCTHKRLGKGRIMLRIFRHWRHFISYGRVSGLYSRSELLEKLEEKSMRVEALESDLALSAKQHITFDDGNLRSTIRKLGERLHQKDSEVKRLILLLEGSRSQTEEAYALLKTLESNQEFRSVMESLVSRQAFCARW